MQPDLSIELEKRSEGKVIPPKMWGDFHRRRDPPLSGEEGPTPAIPAEIIPG
jgi:hypothetical protein